MGQKIHHVEELSQFFFGGGTHELHIAFASRHCLNRFFMTLRLELNYMIVGYLYLYILL